MTTNAPEWNQLPAESIESWGKFQTWLHQKPRGAIRPEHEDLARKFDWATRALAYDSSVEGSLTPDEKKATATSKNLLQILFWESHKLLSASQSSASPVMTPRDLLAMMAYVNNDPKLKTLLEDGGTDLSKLSDEDLETLSNIVQKNNR